MKKSVRMADIARQLGISTVSVSKALAGKPGVSEETRAKVITLAQQMRYDFARVQYQPGMTGNIGVLVSDHLFSENAFYTELYRELVLCSGTAGFSCIVEIVSHEAEQAAVPPLLVKRQRVDGVIFMGEFTLNYLKATAAVGLPCLAVDFRVPGFRIDSICRNNEEGGYLLTQHLLSAGYRQIGFVGNIDSTASIMERYLGYQWALRRSGIVPREEWVLREQDGDSEFCTAFREPPEAFVCSSNPAALHLMDAWQQTEHPGVKELPLVCFEDFHTSVRFGPCLTTYHVEVKRMAEAAVCRMILKIRGERELFTDCIIPGQLIARSGSKMEDDR